MKIRVQRDDGRIEVLTMVPPLIAEKESNTGYFCITTGDGTEHFFRGDGTYDGWGRPVNLTVSDPQEALDLAKLIDGQREIEGEGGK